MQIYAYERDTEKFPHAQPFGFYVSGDLSDQLPGSIVYRRKNGDVVNIVLRGKTGSLASYGFDELVNALTNLIQEVTS